MRSDRTRSAQYRVRTARTMRLDQQRPGGPWPETLRPLFAQAGSGAAAGLFTVPRGIGKGRGGGAPARTGRPRGGLSEFSARSPGSEGGGGTRRRVLGQLSNTTRISTRWNSWSNSIWPGVRSRCPELRLRLVGRGDRFVRHLLPSGLNIEVTGPIEDARCRNRGGADCDRSAARRERDAHQDSGSVGGGETGCRNFDCRRGFRI
jgi:hypothetical protein